jgi:hypothetical protein
MGGARPSGRAPQQKGVSVSSSEDNAARIEALLDQLLDRNLTTVQVEQIERKIKILQDSKR